MTPLENMDLSPFIMGIATNLTAQSRKTERNLQWLFSFFFFNVLDVEIGPAAGVLIKTGVFTAGQFNVNHKI